MNEFEKVLQDVTKPDIQVPIFQQNLRRNLLTSVEVTQPSRVPLGLATFFAGCFGALLILFVAQPEVPNRLHRMIAGEAAPVTDPEPGSPRFHPPQQEAVSVSNDNLLADKRLSRDADRAFLAHWLREKSPKGISRLNQVASEGVLSFRRYLDEGGNEIVVYTSLSKGDKKIY